MTLAQILYALAIAGAAIGAAVALLIILMFAQLLWSELSSLWQDIKTSILFEWNRLKK